jgi:hypothetical protein
LRDPLSIYNFLPESVWACCSLIVSYFFISCSNSNKSDIPIKKESCPATCHGGAFGERRYSSYSFLTLALDGVEWSASRPGHALPPGKGPLVPTGQEAGWASEPVWTQRLEEKSSAYVGYRSPVVQSVVNHYTDWATLTPDTPYKNIISEH